MTFSSPSVYIAIPALAKDPWFLAGLSPMTGQLIIHPGTTRPTPSELCEIVDKYDILVCGISEQLDSRVLSHTRKLKIIGTLSAGLDHIDLKAARLHGITIVNTPKSNQRSVAEHVWSLILCLAKGLKQAESNARRGLGRRSLSPGAHDVSGKVLGVVGAGGTAYHVARIGRAFGCECLVWTFHPEQHPEFGATKAEFCSLERLVTTCDIVSLHLPLSELSRDIVSESLLRKATKSFCLINTARAELIEKGCLQFGLSKGIISGCGLDVYYEDEIPLLPTDRVILTPHIAGLTSESKRRMREELLANLMIAIRNLPEKLSRDQDT